MKLIDIRGFRPGNLVAWKLGKSKINIIEFIVSITFYNDKLEYSYLSIYDDEYHENANRLVLRRQVYTYESCEDAFKQKVTFLLNKFK